MIEKIRIHFSYICGEIEDKTSQLTLLDKFKIGAVILIIIIVIICFICCKMHAKYFTEAFLEDDIEDEELESYSANNLLEDIICFYKLNTVFVLKILRFFIIWFLFFVVIFSFGVSATPSMEPTIMVHDFSVESKLAYLIKTPQRGDIISFDRDDKHYGKRVVGIEGDKIEFHDGYVYINGEIYDESVYLDEDVETNCNRTFEVPEKCVFVLGDNREGSIDSRFWKNPYVSYKEIKSKCLFIVPLHLIFG